jgi:hypothetical protein
MRADMSGGRASRLSVAWTFIAWRTAQQDTAVDIFWNDAWHEQASVEELDALMAAVRMGRNVRKAVLSLRPTAPHRRQFRSTLLRGTRAGAYFTNSGCAAAPCYSDSDIAVLSLSRLRGFLTMAFAEEPLCAPPT